MIEGKKEKKKLKRHIIGAMVEDAPGVMAKISGLFARRGFNIDTIVVGKTATKGVSHIVLSLKADDRTLEQLEKQLNKLVDVIKLVDLNPDKAVVREHCLVRIASNKKTRDDIANISKLHKTNVVDINDDSMIVEVVGSSEKIDNFLKLMRKYGIKEISRTGINAMQRGGNNH